MTNNITQTVRAGFAQPHTGFTQPYTGFTQLITINFRYKRDSRAHRFAQPRTAMHSHPLEILVYKASEVE
jgi:hypothetical protein